MYMYTVISPIVKGIIFNCFFKIHCVVIYKLIDEDPSDKKKNVTFLTSMNIFILWIDWAMNMMKTGLVNNVDTTV